MFSLHFLMFIEFSQPLVRKSLGFHAFLIFLLLPCEIFFMYLYFPTNSCWTLPDLVLRLLLSFPAPVQSYLSQEFNLLSGVEKSPVHMSCFDLTFKLLFTFSCLLCMSVIQKKNLSRYSSSFCLFFLVLSKFSKLKKLVFRLSVIAAVPFLFLSNPTYLSPCFFFFSFWDNVF